MNGSRPTYTRSGVRGPAWRRRGDGFTLLELMVVLIIITLLSTMVVPSAVSAVRRNTIQTEGAKLTELMRFACVTAISRHRQVQVNLDPNRGRCWVSLSSPALPWIEDRQETTSQILATLPLRKDLRLSVALGEDTAGSSSQDWQIITFRSDGRADNALVTLTDPQGDEYAIEILGATGEVIVREDEA